MTGTVGSTIGAVGTSTVTGTVGATIGALGTSTVTGTVGSTRIGAAVGGTITTGTAGGTGIRVGDSVATVGARTPRWRSREVAIDDLLSCSLAAVHPTRTTRRRPITSIIVVFQLRCGERSSGRRLIVWRQTATTTSRKQSSIVPGRQAGRQAVIGNNESIGQRKGVVYSKGKDGNTSHSPTKEEIHAWRNPRRRKMMMMCMVQSRAEQSVFPLVGVDRPD